MIDADEWLEASEDHRSELNRGRAIGLVWDDSEVARKGGDLFDETLRLTELAFKEYGHSLNKAQFCGIEAIAGTYAGMAAGTAKPKNYLSQLATGIGKTTVAVQATKALLANPDFKDVSVIYFLSRLDEIKRLVKDMGLTDEFAILTKDQRLNEEGRKDCWNARVLFTTQQRLEEVSKGGTSFAEMEQFFYKGKPRQVRVWDEAILPSKALVVNRGSLMSLVKGFERLYPKLADAIEDFARSLKDHEGETITVIDIDAYDGPKDGFSLGDFRSHHRSSEDQNIAEGLYGLSGRSARVKKDNESGYWTVEYADILPGDLKPMLILDASGGLRADYDLWQEYRKDLTRLPAAGKSYEGFTIHHLDRSAGTRAPKKGLADDVAKMLSEIPVDEEVLIVTHKPKEGRDLPKEILRQVPKDRHGKLRFIHYGIHKATNDFKHIKYQIHVGLFIYPDAQYEANGRGAMAADVNRSLTKEEFSRIRMGEISDHIFQAAGRGAIRQCVDGKCPPGCHLYMIFSSHKVTGFPPERLREVIFKGAEVVDFDTGKTKGLPQKVQQAVEFIVGVLVTQDQVSTTEVREVLGMSHVSWNNNVVNHPDFLPTLRGEGVRLVRGKGRAGSHFTRG
ncbi:DEAD/DEAH box helicase family protein [Mesorhizobium sp. M6A.T.Ce.TU.002.03.1.1]|uniref:DEAD/DEAH box helicase family protein n=1 Tax=Mesorhizobium sp. M6A.T.Ce.TU.002.03.1.1 TaxID=2496782 RepID=UPI001FDFD5B9|nr:DEAD/DEAH box helicase family protein [Mesorhizobium sp. M6A.T.Ce.TU.002.03.1.1]